MIQEPLVLRVFMKDNRDVLNQKPSTETRSPTLSVSDFRFESHRSSNFGRETKLK